MVWPLDGNGRRGGLVVAVAVAAVACGEPAAPPASCGAELDGSWLVCGGAVRAPDGRTVVMRGMNVSNGNKDAPYLDFHQAADFARMREQWGFNAVRWVMPWAAVEPTQGQYDDAYLDQVAVRLEWAAAAGLVVILDMHQDVYGEGFGYDGAPRWTCDQSHYDAFTPEQPWSINYLDPEVMACFDELWTDPSKGAAFAAAWAHVARRLGSHPAVIGFDVINEPHWGSAGVFEFEAARLQPFYDRVVPAVRAEAPHWLAFLEPASSRNIGIATALTPFAYPDVVYAPHAYDAAAEQGEGFDPARRDAFVDNLAALRAEATRLDAALWIGEYGGLGADPGIGAYMDAAYDGAAAVAASSMYWDYGRGGGYAPLDANGDEVVALVDALVRPYPTRVAGDLVAWDHDPATGVLNVTYRPDDLITAPTEIVVPARLAPSGVDVACQGCAASTDGDVVRITAPPTPGPDGTATITVTPR